MTEGLAVLIPLFVFFAFIEHRLERRLARWSRIEAKLDVLMKHASSGE